MKLVLQQFVSLDGVSQGPGAPDEDVSGGFSRGGWFVPFLDDTLMTHVTSWIASADAFLFGAHTYRNFARDWPGMADPSDPVATALNSLPKYVVSSTLEEAPWAPSTVIRKDALTAVARLKTLPGRELQIHGSARLAGALVAAGLIDEMRLMVAPVVIGQGRRLFPANLDEARAFGLVSAVSTPAGLSIQTYEYTGPARFGAYEPGRSPS
jgi:dihydrofolate reductase